MTNVAFSTAIFHFDLWIIPTPSNPAANFEARLLSNLDPNSFTTTQKSYSFLRINVATHDMAVNYAYGLKQEKGTLLLRSPRLGAPPASRGRGFYCRSTIIVAEPKYAQ